MKSKTRLLILIGFSMLFLVGFGFKKVELLDDKKLIDLGKAIEYARPGGDIDKHEARDDQAGKDKVDSDSAAADAGSAVAKDKTIVISIRGESITYNGRPASKDKIENAILRDNGDNVSFKLVDDFAEAHMYRFVLGILEKKHSELGLKYSKD